jgi:hypothetical protein
VISPNTTARTKAATAASKAVAAATAALPSSSPSSSASPSTTTKKGVHLPVEPWERFERSRETEAVVGHVKVVAQGAGVPFFDLSSTAERYM